MVASSVYSEFYFAFLWFRRNETSLGIRFRLRIPHTSSNALRSEAHDPARRAVLYSLPPCPAILVRALPSLLCVCSAAVMTVMLEMCPAGPHKPLPRAEEILLIFLRGVWPFKLINHSRCANRRERKHEPRTRFLFLLHKMPLPCRNTGEVWNAPACGPNANISSSSFPWQPLSHSCLSSAVLFILLLPHRVDLVSDLENCPTF